MSKYVEEDYSKDYVEGDTPTSSTPTNFDLTAVLNELSLIKAQNIDLKIQTEAIITDNVALSTKLDILLTSINANKTISLAINEKVVTIDENIANIPQLDISELVTKDYIASKVPFVDDKSIAIYPNGTKVICEITNGIFEVVSSKFLPNGDWNYTVVYTLKKEIDGVITHSDFASSYVREIEPDEWIRKTSCPESSA